MNFSNKDMIEDLITSLELIISEKTNKEYAHTAISLLIQKLQNKFNFLDTITNNETKWKIDKKINEIPKKEVYKSIEAIIRIIYMDLKEDAGLFFLSEIEARTKPGFIVELRKHGVDIDLLKIEHHLLFRNLNRIKLDVKKKQNPHQAELKKHIHTEKDFIMEVEEIEKDFLSLLQVQNISQDEILEKLNISNDEMFTMISRLIHFNLIQYITNDEIILTDKGIHYIDETFTNRSTL